MPSPALRLSRTLGEVDVGVTHGIATVVRGFFFMGDEWNDPLPCLPGVPLFFPSYPITLSGVPDRQADNPLETLRGLQEMIQKPKYRDADDKLIIEPQTTVINEYLRFLEYP